MFPGALAVSLQPGKSSPGAWQLATCAGVIAEPQLVLTSCCCSDSENITLSHSWSQGNPVPGLLPLCTWQPQPFWNKRLARWDGQQARRGPAAKSQGQPYSGENCYESYSYVDYRQKPYLKCQAIYQLFKHTNLLEEFRAAN